MKKIQPSFTLNESNDKECSFCKEMKETADIYYPDNAEHETKNLKHLYICRDCFQLIEINRNRSQMVDNSIFVLALHRSLDWCHICGVRSENTIDIMYSEYVRICHTCILKIKSYFDRDEIKTIEILEQEDILRNVEGIGVFDNFSLFRRTPTPQEFVKENGLYLLVEWNNKEHIRGKVIYFSGKQLNSLSNLIQLFCK